MASRFSTLRDRPKDVLPVDQPAGDRVAAVVIPSTRKVIKAVTAESSAGQAKASNRAHDARDRIHRMLLEEINLVALEKLPRAEMGRQIHEFVSEKTRSERLALNVAELDALVDDIVDEMVGLGPLEPLMKDPTINDILINGHENCFVERRGKLEKIHVPFKDEEHLLRIVNKIVAAVGRRVDESQPMVDARMLDGSRFNAAIRPVGVDGGHRALMARIHRLQHVEGFLAAALAEDDAIGAHAKRVLDEVALPDLAMSLDIGGARFHARHVRLLQLQFGRVLDGDQPLFLGDEG
jgi:pilus assembly protein CpaF